MKMNVCSLDIRIIFIVPQNLQYLLANKGKSRDES
jgi:presenilin-like A22 family membrane protease